MKRFLAAAALLCLFPAPALAAVAFGGVSEYASVSSAASKTAPTISGSNILGIVCWQSNSPSNSAPSAITWGGTSMTVVSSAVHEGTAIAYLKSPTSAASVVTTWSGGATAQVTVSYYTGVSQSSPVETTTTNNGLSANPTVSVTTAVANDWLIGCYNYHGGTPVAGSNTTLRGTNGLLADTNAAQSTGSHALNVTISGNTDWDFAALAAEPVGGATSVSPSTMICVSVFCFFQ